MSIVQARVPVVWRPQPRQAEFMSRPEPEALYGGAAGGGKSDALVIEALRQVHIPHYRALILRKTYPQLSDLVDKSQVYYHRAFPQAQYNATAHVWNFPSGAKIYFGSMQYTKDRTNYQGKAFDASLASMPEAEKQALLYGSWDSFSGQVFTEWRNDPAHYEDQRWTHVIAPFTIPKHWQIYRGFDFGFSKPFSVGWYAADEEGRLYRIKELYGCTGRPNEGLRIDPVEQARRIREAEQNDPLLRGRVIHGIADPAIFDESRGESIAAMMERSPNFLRWSPGDNTRLAGKMQFHYRLNFDADGRPMFQVFNTCKHFIRTIPNLVYDESNVEDIDTRQEDHIYDECRYVLMENPISPPVRCAAPPMPDDPLNLHKRARFYRI